MPSTGVIKEPERPLEAVFAAVCCRAPAMAPMRNGGGAGTAGGGAGGGAIKTGVSGAGNSSSSSSMPSFRTSGERAASAALGVPTRARRALSIGAGGRMCDVVHASRQRSLVRMHWGRGDFGGEDEQGERRRRDEKSGKAKGTECDR